MERHSAASIPEEDSAVPETVLVQKIAQTAHQLGRLPLLPQDNQHFANSYGRSSDLLQDKARESFVEVIELGFLSMVYAVRVTPAYPLAPAMKNKPPMHPMFSLGQVRITDED